MQTTPLGRPTATVRTAPPAAAPQWEDLFVEPVYADGQPYDGSDTEEDEGPATNPGTVAA